MYLDAVLTKDLQPIFNASTEGVRTFLAELPPLPEDAVVCVGQTMELLSVAEYQERNDARENDEYRKKHNLNWTD